MTNAAHDIREPSCSSANPSPDDKALWLLVQSVVYVPALVAAERLGYFQALDKRPLTRGDLAAATQTSLRANDVLVDFLLPTGMLLAHADARISLSPLARKYLLASSPFYYGPFLERVAELPLNASALVRAARSDHSSIYDDVELWQKHQQEQAHAEAFALAAHSRALYTATRLGDGNLLDGCRSLLDLGGGRGTYAVELARGNPALHVTLLDLPPVCRLAEAYVLSAGLQARIRVHAADMFRDPLPAEQDAVFMSDICHDWPPARCRELARRVLGCLRPGGKLLINEVLLDEAGGGPIAASVYGVAMLFATQGKQYKLSELEGFLREAGFAHVALADRCGVHSVIVATKPVR